MNKLLEVVIQEQSCVENITGYGTESGPGLTGFSLAVFKNIWLQKGKHSVQFVNVIQTFT